MRTRPLLLLCLVAVAAVLLAATGRVGLAQAGEALTLAVLSDDHVGYREWQATKAENPSSLNLPQFRQNLADIVEHGPDLTVVNGDLVMAMAMDEGRTLGEQLAAWQGELEGIAGAPALELVVSTGNHEANEFDPAINAQYPSAEAFRVWTEWRAAHRYDARAGNGPRPEGENPDHLVLDESRLSFSFDIGPVHIVVLNTDTLSDVTDPATGKPLPGWVPVHWAETDIAAAQADPAVETILVLGHRPIEAPAYADDSWGATIHQSGDHPLGEELSAVLRRNPKVKAYIAGHIHAHHAWRLDAGSGVWQIIAGSAGSECDAVWSPPEGAYFGFCTVRVDAGGRVAITGYGRPVPSAPQLFYEASPIAPTRATPKQTIVTAEGAA